MLIRSDDNGYYLITDFKGQFPTLVPTEFLNYLHALVV